MTDISRRGFLAATSATALAAAVPRKPNFIIFLFDDLGSHDIGYRGATDTRTPNIDALAASGAQFTDWYSNAPVCAPSRGALLTGRYTLRNGVVNNGNPLRPGEKTIASVLKPGGYATGILGKWHLGGTPDTVPNAHGFDYYLGFHDGCTDYYSHRFYWGEPKRVNFHDLWRNREEAFEDGQYLTELIAREAKGFIDAHHNEPFFLYVPFNAVHYPMHAPAKYVERFPKLAKERQMYAAMLSAADDAVGGIMGALKHHGLLNDTCVFFTADNGATTEKRGGLNQQPAAAGDNGRYRGFKFSLFDGGIHMPAVMSWPGVIPRGQTIHEVGMHMDILPTFAKAAGIELPGDRVIDGRDVLQMAQGRAKSPHDAVFWSSGGQLAARQGYWKLVIDGKTFDRTPQARVALTGEDALFLSNLDDDIGETRNQRGGHAAMVNDLERRTRAWAKECEEDRKAAQE
ncbi:MAG: sulfatase-like hydrolase/transferase [Bryobacteraceae bacterium]